MQNYNTNELKKVLTNNGYTPDRQKGSHVIYRKPGFNHVAIPVGKKTVSGPMAKRIIKQVNKK